VKLRAQSSPPDTMTQQKMSIRRSGRAVQSIPCPIGKRGWIGFTGQHPTPLPALSTSCWLECKGKQ
jgi:hypothetical protein